MHITSLLKRKLTADKGAALSGLYQKIFSESIILSRFTAFAGDVARINRLVACVEGDFVRGIHFADGRTVRVVKFMRVAVANVRRCKHRSKSRRSDNERNDCRKKFFHGATSSMMAHEQRDVASS